jgi:hypothetical protein
MGAAASLAACAQSSVVSRHTAFAPPSTRQAAFERARETHVSVVRRQVAPSEHHVATAAGGAKGGGVASFYSEGSSTASERNTIRTN